jgi:hypothetical protein
MHVCVWEGWDEGDGHCQLAVKRERDGMGSMQGMRSARGGVGGWVQRHIFLGPTQYRWLGGPLKLLLCVMAYGRSVRTLACTYICCYVF